MWKHIQNFRAPCLALVVRTNIDPLITILKLFGLSANETFKRSSSYSFMYTSIYLRY